MYMGLCVCMVHVLYEPIQYSNEVHFVYQRAYMFSSRESVCARVCVLCVRVSVCCVCTCLCFVCARVCVLCVHVSVCCVCTCLCVVCTRVCVLCARVCVLCLCVVCARVCVHMCVGATVLVFTGVWVSNPFAHRPMVISQ